MDSNKLHWTETKITEAKRRLNLLLPITHRRDLEEIKKAIETLDWAIIYLKEYQEEAE
jgi:hypothetical protein